MGVYGKSVYYLLDNGVGFQPKDLDPELSRGHPMLYVWSNAVWGNIFGEARSNIRLFNLILSGLLIFSCYEHGRKLFSTKVALLASLILCIQPLFIAQSTLVLPEMMLALLCFNSIGFYLRKRYLWAFFFASAGILSKESAAVIPLAIGIAELFRFAIGKENLLSLKSGLGLKWGPIPRTLILAGPAFVFGIFLLIQKEQHGWYFFPYHQSLIDIRLSALTYKLNRFLAFLFWEQGRWIWLLLAGYGVSIWFLRNARSWKIVLDDFAAFAMTTCIVVFLLFSSINPYMNRYLLILFPILSLLIARIFWSFQEEHAQYAPAALIALIVLPFVSPNARGFDYDENLDYLDQVAVSRDVVQYLIKEDRFTDQKVNSNFPLYFCFQDARYGYFESRENQVDGDFVLPFEHGAGRDEADVWVWMSPGDISNPPYWDEVELLSEFQQGECKGSIYIPRFDADSVEAELRTKGKAFSQAYVNQDTASIRALHLLDAAIFPQRQELINDLDAITRYWTTIPGRKIMMHEMSPSRFEIERDMAYEYGTYQIQGSDFGKVWRDEPYEGKYVLIWQPDENREWKIAVDIWN